MKLYRSMQPITIGSSELVFPTGTVITFDDSERANQAVNAGLVEEIEVITVEGSKNETPTENSDSLNLNKMTVSELKEEADKKGIEYPSGVKKSDLIDLITE